jgi:hypothetical protein
MNNVQKHNSCNRYYWWELQWNGRPSYILEECKKCQAVVDFSNLKQKLLCIFITELIMFIILKHCFIWEISFCPVSIYSILYTHWKPLYSDFWKVENNNILISHNKLSVGQNEMFSGVGY